MTADAQILSILLRLVGAFYIFGALVGVRMITRYAFLDHAIEAISGKKPPAAERLRERLMLAGLAPVFAGGLALIFLSPAAPPLFALGTLWQVVYLGWFAPRYLDPHDEPDAEGREKTWRAFWFYLGATILVFASAFAGVLTGPADGSALTIGAAVTAAFCGWTLRSARNTLKGGGAPLLGGLSSLRGEDPSVGWDDLSESGFKIREPADISVILRPSWNEGALFDATTGNDVSYGWQEAHLSEFARDLVTDVLALFRRYADPYDPRRCALIDPADVAKIEEGAQDALATLRAELGDERVRFEPLPVPVEPVMVAKRVKIEPFDLNTIIYSLDEPELRAISEDHFGISWSLARHLNAWAEDWVDAHDDDAHDDDAPGDSPARAWTEADHDAHEERGRILAVRLKREFAATGRGDVMVYYMTRRIGLLEAHAADEIPPLPAPPRD